MREITRRKKAGAIAIKSFALLFVLATAYQAMAQNAPTPYPKMAPIEQYFMDRTAEIALARERLQLKLADSKIFKSGCVALRYLKQ